MCFNHHTGSEKDAPKQEPDITFSVAIIIDTLIHAGCLKCFSQPLFYVNFCLQFKADSVVSPLFPHLSNPDK